MRVAHHLMNPILPPMTVLGTGFFSPHYNSIDDLVRDKRCEPRTPSFAMVPTRMRRFTSVLTQLQLEVVGAALADAGHTAPVRSVFASAHGELSTMLTLLEGWLDNAEVSASRFVQSVHSTAAGLFSIATKNTEASNTIAAGSATVGAGLLDGALLLAERQDPVLVTFGDGAS